VDGIQRLVGGCFFVVRLVLIPTGKSKPHSQLKYSEDCLPEQGEIEGIGASLPEFELLGYPETKQAYYIRCSACVKRFTAPTNTDDRAWGEAWLEEIRKAESEWNGEGEEIYDMQASVQGTDSSSNVGYKKEISPSTITTEAEEHCCEVVAKGHVKREVIVID
jgi:hypothetical protein